MSLATAPTVTLTLEQQQLVLRVLLEHRRVRADALARSDQLLRGYRDSLHREDHPHTRRQVHEWERHVEQQHAAIADVDAAIAALRCVS